MTNQDAGIRVGETGQCQEPLLLSRGAKFGPAATLGGSQPLRTVTPGGSDSLDSQAHNRTLGKARLSILKPTPAIVCCLKYGGSVLSFQHEGQASLIIDIYTLSNKKFFFPLP